MKHNYKKLFSQGLIAGTLVFFAVILLFAKKEKDPIPSFVERSGPISNSGEWLNSRAAIQGLLDILRRDPSDTKAMLQLAQAYIQEARITGNHAWYDKASLELLERILGREPRNFDALCCKATVLLSQHHFTEGLSVAQSAMKINPHNAFIYGLLCDAYVELGNYKEAVKMSDKMISIRPDIRSYARVSYLREIHGDRAGAIEAMKLAVASGYPGLEQTEWTRIMLGHLYENSGCLDSAELHYRIALEMRPDYAYALAGLGRIEKQKGNYKQAIAWYEKAKALMIDYSFADELTDLYLLNNEIRKSERSAKEVIAMLSPGEDVEGVEGHGHYADRELAYAYLKTGELDLALKHAQTEYERRPNNIDVCETLAWVQYKRGQYSEANKLITTALRTNSVNPVLLCHAGLIKIKCGERELGRNMIKKALDENPFIDTILKKEVVQYIAMN
jgi:tetratricopeptide (TPR) repeat protein